MKFIHLADLHLGKKVFGYDLDEEQRDALMQVLALSDEQQIDGVLISGDVYDTAIPPVSAIGLFNWFLNELHQRDLEVFIISGNHDSADRLGFGSELLEESRVHISSVYEGTVPWYDLEKDGERVRIHMLPFIKPMTVRARHQCECPTWDDAMEIALNSAAVDPEAFNILMSHQFFAGSEISDSETHSVGTLDQISIDFLEPFDYAALGHLHRPQFCQDERFRYCGTLLKYSASELDTPKTITLLEVHPGQPVKIEEFPVVPKRDFVRIRGIFDEIISREFYEKQDLDNYFYVVLDDEQEIFQVYDRLREIYPKLLKIEYAHIHVSDFEDIPDAEIVRLKSPLEIFQEFFEMQNGTAPTDEQMKIITDAWEGLHEAD